MFSHNGQKPYPDLNYFSGPFYRGHQYQHREEESKLCQHSGTPSNLGNTNIIGSHFFPKRQVKLVVLQKEEEKGDYIITYNSFHLDGGDKRPKFFEKHEENIMDSTDKSEHSMSDLHHSFNPNFHQPKFTVNKEINFSNELMTEFNNHPKLKKINSSYHLKRKISTKLQNDIKNSINNLITEVNREYNLKLPLMNANSKEFRENVKIDCLKKYADLTIAKYICEDALVERKKPANAGLQNNIAVIEQIEKIYDSASTITESLKKLFTLLNQTLVKDYYEQFLESSRFKKCKQKDSEKYSSKLSKISNLNFTKKKEATFVEIYSLKYDGIAKNYFN